MSGCVRQTKDIQWTQRMSSIELLSYPIYTERVPAFTV